MATPYIGLGVLTSVDAKSIGLVVNSTPPSRERELVDVTALDSTLQTYKPGIEKHSQWQFDLLRDPDDTNQSALYTLFGAKTDVSCIITYSDSTPATWTFTGFVSMIEPQQIEHNKPLMWRVTIQRTGSITVG